MHKHSYIPFIHATRQRRIFLPQQRALLSEIPEVIKRHSRAVWMRRAIIKLMRPYPHPRQFASYSIALRLSPYPSNTDHGIKVPPTNRLHAVVVAEDTSLPIRIT